MPTRRGELRRLFEKDTLWAARSSKQRTAQTIGNPNLTRRNVMDHIEREYGKIARVGVALPPANTTVEPEMQILMPPGVSVCATRMISQGPTARQRLIDYAENVDSWVESFYGAELDAFFFACTGSCYLIGHDREIGMLNQVSKKWGMPVFSAASSITHALQSLRVGKLALISPYPEWLTEVASSHWKERGFDVVAVEHVVEGGPIDPTMRGIYAMRADQVGEAFGRLNDHPKWQSVEAVLITGVGMASMAAISQLSAKTPVPVISSMLCLAWAGLKGLGIANPTLAADGGLVTGAQMARWLSRAPA
jgi:maleate isomerase